MKRLLFIFSGLFLCLLAGMPQNVNISGIVNHYLQVESVLADRVTVTSSTELTFFQPGDKVLLIQMTGATLSEDPPFLTNTTRARKAWNNAGRFEILQVDDVITGGTNQVIFTDNTYNSYDAGEKIQLVRLVEGDIVTVTGKVTAKEWDGNTGGIVAIIGMDSVILKEDIDVNMAGFIGGTVPGENYTGGCRKDVSFTELDTLYFLPTQLGRSGNKGEGIISKAWTYTKGTGFALNGGGAGNGLFSGGAGGGNFRQGGDGGRQSAVCTDLLLPSWGGYACYDLYSSSRRQIIMGGGGGSGVKSATKTASKGGDGGGIVIIITGVLSSNNRSITANGETVTDGATGSGGGGGAGGTVLLDVTKYTGALSVGVRGGNGGRTTDVTCTGSGGGGGGGVLWYSGTGIPGVAVDTTQSTPGGVSSGCLTNIGDGGSYGTKLKNLLTPLTGFLFNSIRGVDTICAGQIPPKPLTGSQPKGGDGNYDYLWQQSTNQVNWVPAVGTPSLKALTLPALTQTTWYRRIVNSDFIIDTSRTLEVYVYNAITNNTISGTDTICYNLQAKTLTGTNPAGGNNVYNYNWQHSANQTDWNNKETNSFYNPGQLLQTAYYRRIVTSTKYCSHTSNTVKITVLPSIANNSFVTPDTVLCENQAPGLLNAKTPLNGDGTYSYHWQYKTVPGSWTSISSSNVKRFNAGPLTDTTFYRRIVYSGNDQACKDTSAFKTIAVLPAISGNLITSATMHYCAGEIPGLISGAQPEGGDGSYTYRWRIRTTGSWADLPGIGATSMNYIPDQIVESNTQFSRIISSGLYNACHDTSAALPMAVVPYINNNLALADQTICENDSPVQLNPPAATGGLGGFTYRWIQHEEDVTGWVNAPGTATQLSYAPGALTVTTLFARKATSDNCTHISDTVTVTVYPAISSNSIPGGTVQYACYNAPKTLAGSLPAYGNGNYAYQWEQSSNNTDWIPATGTAKDFLTPGLTSTQYFRRVVYSSPLQHECADTSNPVEVRINPLPTGDVISSVDTLCKGEPLVVHFALAGIHPPFAVNIGGQTKTGINTSPDSIAIIPLSTQSFPMISVTDDSGCVADPAGYDGQARAVVYEIPVANAWTDDSICSNSYVLRAEKSVAGSVGSWSGTGVTFADPADPHSLVTVDQYGMNSLTWTETNWHCADDDQVQVIFYEQPGAADAGADQALDFTYTTQLQALMPAVGSGKWTVITGAGIFNNDTLPDAVVRELESTTTLQWTVHNGNCPEVSDKMDILINPLVIAKGFTPNGDTKNDYFNLGAVYAEKISIKIYNSTGILVFESDDYRDGDQWDGKNMNGVELPEGTYFYIADMKIAGREKEFQFRSFVEILR